MSISMKGPGLQTYLRRWLRPTVGAPLRPSRDGPWEDRLLHQMKDFVGEVLRDPPRAETEERRQRPERPKLPFDLYLALASHSLELFGAGPIDDFAFLQRDQISARHDTEFLTRLDPENQGSEEFQAFGVIRLYSDGKPLPPLANASRFWEGLARHYGLDRIPEAKPLLVRRPDDSSGRNGQPPSWRVRVVAPRNPTVFARVGVRRFFHAEALRILRRRLTPIQKISWLEEAFPGSPRPGEIVHRYYLTAAKQVYLVRHHWSNGKLLFRAEVSADARRLCLESQAFARLRRVARKVSRSAARRRLRRRTGASRARRR